MAKTFIPTYIFVGKDTHYLFHGVNSPFSLSICLWMKCSTHFEFSANRLEEFFPEPCCEPSISV